MNIGLERLHIAARILLSFTESMEEDSPKLVSIRRGPVGEPDTQDSRKIFISAPNGLFLVALNAPSLRRVHVHTKNGNNAGKTLIMKSSKPLAAPIIDDELNITNPMPSIKIIRI